MEEREGEEERKKRVRADDRCVPNLPIATNQIESITHSESELLLVKTVRGGTGTYLLDIDLVAAAISSARVRASGRTGPARSPPPPAAWHFSVGIPRVGLAFPWDLERPEMTDGSLW